MTVTAVWPGASLSGGGSMPEPSLSFDPTQAVTFSNALMARSTQIGSAVLANQNSTQIPNIRAIYEIATLMGWGDSGGGDIPIVNGIPTLENGLHIPAQPNTDPFFGAGLIVGDRVPSWNAGAGQNAIRLMNDAVTFNHGISIRSHGPATSEGWHINGGFVGGTFANPDARFSILYNNEEYFALDRITGNLTVRGNAIAQGPATVIVSDTNPGTSFLNGTMWFQPDE